ncbi:hypothetical protein [Pantoea latae]|nr:hypothetical protein [Pantoea latae]
MLMPSGQFYILDKPEHSFSCNYQLDTVADRAFESRMLLEIQKENQPVEVFAPLSIGEEVVFVSPSGEAKNLFLISETDSHFIFSSRA